MNKYTLPNLRDDQILAIFFINAREKNGKHKDIGSWNLEDTNAG